MTASTYTTYYKAFSSHDGDSVSWIIVQTRFKTSNKDLLFNPDRFLTKKYVIEKYFKYISITFESICICNCLFFKVLLFVINYTVSKTNVDSSKNLLLFLKNPQFLPNH